MAKKVEPVERPQWQLPPDEWFRTQLDRSVQDGIAEYYKAFPEHRPPADTPLYKALAQAKSLLSETEQRVEDARFGNPSALIVHLEDLRAKGALDALASVEFDFLVGLLKAREGESHRERLREIEWFLIASAVERRVGEGQKQESAIRAVMKERNFKRTTVFKALAAYRRKYGQTNSPSISSRSALVVH